MPELPPPFSLQGRINRVDYFAAVTAYSAGAVVIAMIAGLITILVGPRLPETVGLPLGIAVFGGIALIVLVMATTLWVRRWHDVGISAVISIPAYMLIVLANPLLELVGAELPAVFGLVLFVPLFIPGQAGENRFGPPPAGQEERAASPS